MKDISSSIKKFWKGVGEMGKTLNEMFASIIGLNEGATGNIAYEFHHAKGGTSGWSFGKVQWDVKNNSGARLILSKIGFNPDEIQGIVDESVDPRQWNSRLLAGKVTIDAADVTQLSYCLNKGLNFAVDHGIPVENPSGILALADAENQYGNLGAGTAQFDTALGHPVTAADVLAWRLQTKYGRECPDDCKRRIQNVMGVVNEQETT